ncbi:hypothetical protein ACRRTK_007547 [Alexandromys fortis]
MELYPERNPAAKLDSPVLITFRIQILSKRVSHVANTYNPFLSDIQANVELKGAEEQPLPTESPETLSDYGLSKPHEVESMHSTEAPTHEDEDAGESENAAVQDVVVNAEERCMVSLIRQLLDGDIHRVTFRMR